MNKIIKWIVDLIFLLFIIVLVGYFVLRFVGIIEIYQVETGSMESGIHAGDYVLIVTKDEYFIGDIVTYKKDDYFITHRIIKSISGNKVITKGDANNTEDEEISVDAIEGKVILHGGLLNVVIDYKYGIVSFLLGVYLLTLYFSKKGDDSKLGINDVDSVGNESVMGGISFRRLKRRIRPGYRNK